MKFNEIQQEISKYVYSEDDGMTRRVNPLPKERDTPPAKTMGLDAAYLGTSAPHGTPRHATLGAQLSRHMLG